MTTEEFIVKANNKHGNKYDYSEVIYTKSTDKVEIICKLHGKFLQTPHKHMQGDGCPKCGVERIREKTTGTLQNFLNRAVTKHGSKYDYSKAVYVAAKKKVTIVCPTHGEFEQTPDDHTRGRGCPTCSKEEIAKRMIGNRQVTVKDFIERASIVHSNKYDYSKVKFTVTIDKVIIVCPVHGEFKLSVNKHLLGNGCSKCAMHNRVQNGWSTSMWSDAGKKSKKFFAYSVYVVKCSNVSESFYKIGKTFNTVEKRIKKFVEAGYSVDIIKVFTGTAEDMSIKEKEMHKENRDQKYIPNTTFCGMHECYCEVRL